MRATGQSQGTLEGVLATIRPPSLWISNAPMVRRTLILALVLPLAAAAIGCASREDIEAKRMAEQAATQAEDDATCQAKGAPGSAEYDACRRGLAAQRARKAEIDYQKARDFDRVLGGLDDL
jgi:hypothetical protein